MTKQELIEMICEIFNIEKPTKMMLSQITKFVTEHGYNYKGIGRALYYFRNVKQQVPKVEMGIGIVPYVYDEAAAYFDMIKKNQKFQKEQGEVLKKSKNTNRKVFKANAKRDYRKKQTIDLEDL